jgi:ketosteroid isomerase-like protein
MHMSHKNWLILWLACSSSALASAPSLDPGAATCSVWQRELSFAQSVQQHDAAAFAGHVMADAVFDANTMKPTRGRAAIQQHWATFIDGKTLRLDWYPQQVVASGDGTLAYSSGVYLFENPAPGAQPRYTIGKFATVWRRADDGVWRVAFDGGDAGQPASEAEVAAVRAGRQTACPATTAAR